MARIKKFLAAISATITLGVMAVSSLSASAIAYTKVDGKFYSDEEMGKFFAGHNIFLDIDKSIATKKVSEKNITTYVLDTNSELYQYMRDNLGLTSNELSCSYVEYEPESGTYNVNDAIPDIDNDGVFTDEIELYRTLSDEELEKANIKRLAYIGGCLGCYHKTLSIYGNTYNPNHIDLEELIDNEIKPLDGVKYVSGYSMIFASSLGEPVDVEPLSGDLSMDGKVNIVDAVKLAKYNADPTAYPLLTYSQLAADVNGDGELTNADLIELIKMI